MDNEFICQHCGKSFQERHRYAGHMSMCNIEKIKCKICGKQISRNKMNIHMKTHMNLPHCLFCGKEIPKGRKFCNSSCSAKYNNAKRGIVSKERREQVCKNCGKKYLPSYSSLGKFCSQECTVKYKFKQKDKLYVEGKVKEIKTLKRHFLKHNENKCSICGLSTWQDKEITLILDHIDGNSDNNFPSNLRLVCPNCDSQLDTFKGRNKGNGRYSRRIRYHEGKSY